MINGIKPIVSTPTKLNLTPTTFDEAMTNFCNKLTEDSQEYISKFNHIESVTFNSDGGRKYIKVKYFQTNVDTDYETGVKTVMKDTKGSIHCFVESTTGDIYKPAGWKAPYTKGNNAVRGNIYDASTFQKTDMHGGWLYAR